MEKQNSHNYETWKFLGTPKHAEAYGFRNFQKKTVTKLMAIIKLRRNSVARKPCPPYEYHTTVVVPYELISESLTCDLLLLTCVECNFFRFYNVTAQR